MDAFLLLLLLLLFKFITEVSLAYNVMGAFLLIESAWYFHSAVCS